MVSGQGTHLPCDANIALSTCLQVFVNNVTQGAQDAADIVLVVDESGSMKTEHEWLLVMIPLLEEMLVSEGTYYIQWHPYHFLILAR